MRAMLSGLSCVLVLLVSSITFAQCGSGCGGGGWSGFGGCGGSYGGYASWGGCGEQWGSCDSGVTYGYAPSVVRYSNNCANCTPTEGYRTTTPRKTNEKSVLERAEPPQTEGEIIPLLDTGMTNVKIKWIVVKLQTDGKYYNAPVINGYMPQINPKTKVARYNGKVPYNAKHATILYQKGYVSYESRRVIKASLAKLE